MKIQYIVILLAILLANRSLAQESKCDYKAEILLNGTEFENGKIGFRVRATRISGMPTEINGTADIRDFSGKTAKLYKIWESEQVSKQKTSNEYSPILSEGGNYRITAKIDVKCSDSNQDDNLDTKMIKIKGQKTENEIHLKDFGTEQKSQVNGTAYESSNEKAGRLILIFLLVLSVLLNAVLIWKR